MLAVELAEKRLKRYRFSFDFSYIKANLHELIRKIPLEDDAEGDTNTLARFSNVVKLAVKDEYLFSLETQFPTDFLHHIIKIMLKFHNESMIGKRCLELISKMLMNPQTLQNVNQYLTNHEQFIRFLGSQIGKLEEDIEGPIFVFTLLATLIKHNLEKFTSKAKNQGSVWINWKLSSIFSYIHRVAKLEILEFLLAIFKTNFKCPLIQIEELDLPSAEFAKILLNLLFHLQALLHKVSSRESKEAIWAILFELLRHAEQGIVVKQSTFQTDVLFQPWFKVAVTYLLSQCVFPSNVPLISLEFLQKWTKLILLNKLENRSNRSPLQQSFLFQPYSSVFTMIRDAMKRDPSQLSQQDRLKITTVRQGSSTVFDIERKSGCIARIIKTCETFLATLQ
ncbi:unnamed protein product [Orchesella dallaii]|uniref:Telomere-associated protein Rif1 N-terminal domain-containing protein n=1 Tax=Orchesella dallaii TaxID=48710 RepID=A0ABP1R844_9HEXA